jgi:hypothetical protein
MWEIPAVTVLMYNYLSIVFKGLRKTTDISGQPTIESGLPAYYKVVTVRYSKACIGQTQYKDTVRYRDIEISIM